MLKRQGLGAIVVLLASCGVAVAAGNVNFLLGDRSMDNEANALDKQSAFGVNGDFGGDSWPVRLAWGANFSVESQDETDSAIFDLSFGVTYIALRNKRIRPYVGVGLATVGIAIDDGFISESDQSFGYYGNVGVYGRLGPKFNLGIDYRLMRGTDVELLDFGFDADYSQVSLLVGFGWPAYQKP